ncbi:unnamed protein product [Prunus armeniaca]
MDFLEIGTWSLFPWLLYCDKSQTSNMGGADFDCTKANYEALIIGLEILKELRVNSVSVMGDSMLVLKQFSDNYKVTSQVLLGCHSLASRLMEDFDDGLSEELFKVEKRSLSSVFKRGTQTEVMVLTIAPKDWRLDIVQYLKTPNGSHREQVRRKAQYYVIRDEVLFRISSDDFLMKCLGKKEQLVAMTDVHEGICGAHQAGIKMRWLLRRHGYY